MRPALVVSADSWNGHASTVTVLPITRTSHDFPTRIELEATGDSGLDVTSYARCEDTGRSASADCCGLSAEPIRW